MHHKINAVLQGLSNYLSSRRAEGSGLVSGTDNHLTTALVPAIYLLPGEFYKIDMREISNHCRELSGVLHRFFLS